MKVLRPVDYFPPYKKVSYGLQPTFYHLSREQVKLGIDVHVISGGYPNQRRFKTIEGIKIHRVSKPYNLTMLYEIYRLCRQKKFDIIHLHATTGFSYSILHRFIGKLNIIKLVAHVHGDTKGINLVLERIGNKFKIQSRDYSILRETIVWHGADALITNSNFLKEELVSLYNISRRKVYVAYNGVDLETFYPRSSRQALLSKLGMNPKTPVIMYLGGFRPIKGPSYFLKAIENISDRKKDIKALFVGGVGPLDILYREYFTRTLKTLERRGSLVTIGGISHVELPEYYSAVDAIVVPSLYDAFPKVILEAMACGTPVIASNVGGVPEIVSNRETGLLVKSANPDELTESIIEIVSNPELRERISAKARKLIENFSWRNSARHVMNVYQKILY